MKRIRYFADMSPGTGYGNAARGYIRALETLGYSPETLHVVPAISAYGGVEVDTADWLRPYVISPWLEQEDINIVHVGPGLLANYWTSDRHNIAITAWETNHLPTAKGQAPCMLGVPPLSPAEALNLYDEVWAPSVHCKRVFVASGVEEAKIRVIPHALWYDLKPRQDSYSSRNARFYYIGSWNVRKNPVGLLRAYFQTEWTTSTPVSLFLHGLPASREPNILEANDTLVRAEIDLLREAMPVERRMNLPTYVPSTQYRPEGWIREAHDHGDVFVTMSRGEGFCLPALEALAAGNLVIGGGGPAVEELGAGVGGIELMLRILPRVQVPITPMPECLGYELTQEWWETYLTYMRGAFVKAAQDLREQDWAPVRRTVAESIREMYSPARIAGMMKF